MLCLIAGALLISYGTFTYLIYRQSVTVSRNEVRQEAQYIKRLLASTGKNNLQAIDTALSNTRITLIDFQGNVLYDTNTGIEFENHLQRPEVQQVLSGKIGEDIRTSDTLGMKMFYYAELADGKILRIAKKFHTVWVTALRILPVILIVGIVMLALATVLAKILVDKIIGPINRIDLENPLNCKNYDEIMPLLESIERQNREKEKVDTMRKEFSANVSHELKTPLTSISGYAELIKDGIVQKQDIEKFAERIYNEAQRLIALIGKIMLLSRLDEEKIDIQKEEVGLRDLFSEICQRLAPLAQKKNVHIELEGANPHVNAIRCILDEMLYNLCENAIKYNRENGSVTISLSEQNGRAAVRIQDTGMGIAEENLDRIFERFYRADKSHNGKIGGSGLGLSIVKHGAMLHGMRIHVESELGKGTVFTLEC